MLCRLIGIGILAGLAGTATPDRTIESAIVEVSRLNPRIQYMPFAPVAAEKESPADRFAMAFALPAAGPEKSKDSSYVLGKLKEWREAAAEHNPGSADRAAAEIGRWEAEDLDAVLDFLTELASKSDKTIRRTLARAPIRTRLLLTGREVEQGDLNRVLKQGAMLHTDISLFNLETRNRSSDLNNLLGAFVDGRLYMMPGKIHWDYARRLIDAVSPSPSEDALAHHWYVATTAHILSQRNLAYAEDNIESALKKFPSDYRILFYAGALHETWAAPLSQNTPLPPRGKVNYGSRQDELKRARKLYQRAVSENPDFAEGHLRFGRVLGQLGRHDQAIDALNKAHALTKDPRLSYYIALFLGREFEATSRLSEARGQYERAAMLYPGAQSPGLALSLLAHGRSDSQGALDQIEEVLALPHKDLEHGDPFWTYDLAPIRDADALIAELHRMSGEIER